ncbi:DUF3037 domain-containing protein [Microcoleus sp. S36b_A4]|uniref:DUF3037 domain-containing protein n=1 Tax=Microcoleus sp. S36b_A4 TaxID=3055420 RepID=UPI002FD26C9C
MPDRFLYDYAIIRVVPKVEREEFINVGAIVSCGTKKFLEARIEIDEQRLMAIDSTLDLEMIRNHLAVIPIICAGGKESGAIGQLPHRERFHWLVAPRSTIVQTSRVHTGFCQSLPGAIEHLLDTMVRSSSRKPSLNARLLAAGIDSHEMRSHSS